MTFKILDHEGTTTVSLRAKQTHLKAQWFSVAPIKQPQSSGQTKTTLYLASGKVIKRVCKCHPIIFECNRDA